jgi:exodeoxyribonuclease VII large subunit
VTAQPAPRPGENRSGENRPGENPVLSVGEITELIAGLLGEAFPRVAVRGQVSNLRRQSSGHLYFTLKDADAQLPAVMWRSSAARLRFRPEDGQELVASGRVEVYPPHGKYQLVCDTLAPLGLGELHLRFEQLKKRLAAEGLFDEERKRPLPRIPRRVAVITSPTGAAVRDFLKIAYRRMPRAWVTVVPCRVQGEGSCDDVVAALRTALGLGCVDVVVVARGGGSIEDLWTFNEEDVARGIAASPVPVVSAVGHETDTTIADFVADVRAATPSEAAEIVFPDVEDLQAQLDDGRRRLARAVTQRMQRARESLVAIERTHALARPLERLRRIAQDLDDWERRGLVALDRQVRRARERVGRVAGHLEAVSPLAVLARGYSITTRDGAREALRGTQGLAPGDRIVSRLARGAVVSEVVETREDVQP